VAGGNPLTLLSDFYDGVTHTISSVASDVGGEINSVLTPIDSTLTDLGEEFGTGINAVLSDLGAFSSDIENAGASFGDAIGAATSSLAQEAEAGFGSIQGVTTLFIDTEINIMTAGLGTTLGPALLNELGTSPSAIEGDITDFAKEYGHAIIDVAANAIFPGSSVLIDLAWDIASTGQLPSLQGLVQDSANAALAEILPGVDEAVAAALPDILSGIASASATGLVNSTIETFCTDLVNGQPMTLAQMEASFGNATLGAIMGDSDAADAVNGAITDSVTSVLDDTDLGEVGALAIQGSDLILSGADAVSELTGLTPAQILALGANISGVTKIAEITLGSGTPVVDIAQALALDSAGISLSGDLGTVSDIATSIEGISASALAILPVDHIYALQSMNAPLDFTLSQAQDIVADGLRVSATTTGGTAKQPGFFGGWSGTGGLVTNFHSAAGGPAISLSYLQLEQEKKTVSSAGGVPVLISCTQDQFNSLSTAQLNAFAQHGITGVNLTDVTVLNWNYQQALTFTSSNLTINGVNSLTFDAREADVMSLAAPVEGELTVAQMQNFINANVNTINISGHFADFFLGANTTLTSGIADLAQFPFLTIDYTIDDTVAGIVADIQHHPTQIAAELANPNVTWDISDTAGDFLSLTMAQKSALAKLGPQAFSARINPSYLTGLTAAQITTLAGEEVKTLVSTTGSFAITQAQAQEFLTAGIQLSLGSGGTAIIDDTSAHIATMRTTLIGQLPSLGISTIETQNTTLTLTVRQYLAVAQAGLAVGFVTPTPSTKMVVSDSAIAIGGLDYDQITQLAQLGVSAITVMPTAITLNLSQCFAFIANHISITDSLANGISVADTSFNIAALSAEQVTELRSIGITQMTVTAGSPSLDALTAVALEGNTSLNEAPITLVAAAGSGSLLSVTDSAYAGQAMELTPAEIDDLPSIGIDIIRLTEGALLSVAQVEAILANPLQVQVVPASSGAGETHYIYAIADSAANITAFIDTITTVQANEMRTLNITGLISLDQSLTLTIAQSAQFGYVQVPTDTSITPGQTQMAGAIIIADTATAINANWNYLNELRAAGRISGVEIIGQAAPRGAAGPSFGGTAGGPALTQTISEPLAHESVVAGRLPNGSTVTSQLTLTVSILNAAGIPTDLIGTLAGPGLTKLTTGEYGFAAASASALTAELQQIQFTGSGAPGSDVNVTLQLNVTDGSMSSNQTVSINTEQEALLYSTPASYSPALPGQLWYTTGGSVQPFSATGAVSPVQLTSLGSRSLFINGQQQICVMYGSPTSSQVLAIPNFRTNAAIGSVILNAGGEAIISGLDTSTGYYKLWATDGTLANTVEILLPGDTNEYAGFMEQSGNAIYFEATDPAGGRQLWVTTNDFANLTQLTSVAGGAIAVGGVIGNDSEFAPGPSLATVNGLTVFSGDSAADAGNDGTDSLYVTNNTAGGTSILKTLYFANFLTALNGTVIFAAQLPGGTDQLWTTNGTAAGTTPLSSVIEPYWITANGAYALLDGYASAGAKQTVWLTNGSNSTVQLMAMQYGVEAPITVPVAPTFDVTLQTNFTVFGRDIIFTGQDTAGDNCLWISDGQAQNGTAELYNFGTSTVSVLNQMLGELFFVVTAPSVNQQPGTYQIWETNSTAAGTKLSLAP